MLLHDIKVNEIRRGNQEWKKTNSHATLDKGHRTMTNKTKATQRTKKMSNTDSIKKHRCTNVLEHGTKFLFV